MHNLGVVIAFELIRTLKKKTFWFSALAFPAIFAAVAGLSYLSNKSADDATAKLQREKFSFVVVDQSHLVSPAAVQLAGGRIGTDPTAAMRSVKAGSVDAAIIYPAQPATQRIRIYAADAGLTDNGKYTAAAQELLQSSVVASIGSPEKVALIRGNYDTQLTTYSHGVVTKGFERVIVPGLFLVLFYALIVLLGNQMLTSTTEEKENRVIEMILTTVTSRVLILGKIITMIILGIIQVAAIVLPLAVAYAFFRSALNIPHIDPSQLVFDPVRIIIGLLVFATSFLLFTGLLVAIGSAMPTAKEASGFFGFTILIMFAPLYALAAIVSSPGLPMVKGFSFFPLTAPVTLLLRNAVGNLSVPEAVVGVSILTVSSLAALALAIHSFRTGSLQYDRKLSLREMFHRS